MLLVAKGTEIFQTHLHLILLTFPSQTVPTVCQLSTAMTAAASLGCLVIDLFGNDIIQLPYMPPPPPPLARELVQFL